MRPNRRWNAAACTGNFTNFEKVLSCTSGNSKLDELARAVMTGRVLIAIFYHFLISIFSLFHWELCTTVNAHSTLAYSQHQHQATSWWHDDALVRCSHVQQWPFRTLRSSKKEPQQRENERKGKREHECVRSFPDPAGLTAANSPRYLSCTWD